MAYDLTDFADIVDRVVSQLKLDENDTAEIDRIKADINDIYIEEVVPFKRWLWLSGNTNLQFLPFYGTGTVTVTPDSTTITFSVAPSTSKTGYLFATDDFSEIYTISSHVAAASTATLSSKYTGTLNTAAAFKIWTDQLALPTDCREVVEAWHDFSSQPMENKGVQDFRRLVSEQPRLRERPSYFNTYDFVDPTPLTDETESDRYRVIRLFPSLYDNSTTIHVDYTKEVEALELDGDEPLMPIGDRIVLVYGALELAWTRARNPEAAVKNQQKFAAKLARMAGNVEDSTDKPQLTPDSRYLARKRARGIRSTRGTFSGGGSYTIPSYLRDVTIEGGNVTDDITVVSGVLIDGRDISADGAALDAIGTLANGKIYMGNASNVATEVTPSGDVTMDNTGVNAIAAGVIVNADVNASAAIARSKIASGTASYVVVNDIAGAMSERQSLSIGQGGTNATAKTGAFDNLSPLSQRGDVLTHDGTNNVRLVGNDTTTKMYLQSVGNGVSTAAPTWQQVAFADLSGVNTIAKGGTNSSTALNNNRVMQSSGGAVVEAAAITASRMLISDSNGIPTHSTVTSTEITYLADSEALTSATLADNTASAANVATWTAASFDTIFLDFSMKRGSANKAAGRLAICTDGTNASIAQSGADIGTLGVTFTVDVSAGSLRLRYTTTSTGTAVTMKYRVQKWLA